MRDVVAALIWQDNKFMICQRPETKARGLLWEFVGGKTEPGETLEDALIRECREELDITVKPVSVFCEVDHVYPDITIHLTLFNAVIADGTPKLLEHNDLKWITPAEIKQYEFCPADKEILKLIIRGHLSIRPADKADVNDLLRVYDAARKTMRENGNMTQWPSYYPGVEDFLDDIKNNALHVVLLDGEVCGAFAYFDGIEPTYNEIDGAWLNDKPYSFVHRIASDRRAAGIFDYIIDYCKSKSGNIKIDTHKDNTIMQHLITKNGFKECGIVIIENGTERIAYQYTNEQKQVL